MYLQTQWNMKKLIATMHFCYVNELQHQYPVLEGHHQLIAIIYRNKPVKITATFQNLTVPLISFIKNPSELEPRFSTATCTAAVIARCNCTIECIRAQFHRAYLLISRFFSSLVFFFLFVKRTRPHHVITPSLIRESAFWARCVSAFSMFFFIYCYLNRCNWFLVN